MQIYPLAIAGSALLITVTTIVVAVLSQRRLRRVERELTQRRQDDELDRQRIRTTLERGQLEVTSANNQLKETRIECERLRQDLEQQEALAKETLKKFTDTQERYTVLLEEHRAQRAQVDQLSSARAELVAEKKHLEETKKALATARTNAEKLQREAAETKRLLVGERLRLAEKEKQQGQAQTEIVKLGEDVAKLSTKLTAAYERLRLIERLEAKTTELSARNTELERELSQVIQVASTVNAVELDREELQVRLETAAISVRLARKEADRYRASFEGLEVEVRNLRNELSTLRTTGLERERLSAENAKLIEAQTRHTQLVQSLQSRLDETVRTMQAAEARADEATSEQQRTLHAMEDSELERRELRSKLEVMGQYGKQAEQLRLEVATLAQADQRRRSAEADVTRLTAELRANQAALRNAQSNAAELERLRDTVTLLRDEQRSHLEAEQRLLALQAELRTLKGGVTAAHEKRIEAEQLERLRDENLRLRDDAERLRVHEKASIELEQLTAEYKRVRLESELLTRRVQELGTVQEEVAELRRQSADHQELRTEARELTDALKQLEAQLYALGHIPQTKHVHTSIRPITIGTKAHDIETRLTPMLERTKLRSVVLADASGFPVVTAGESLAQEGLAAFSALASQIAQRARRLLPVGNVLLVNLIDDNRMVVSCRLFSLGEEEFAVATIGPEELDLLQTDEVVAALQQSMSSTHTLNGGTQVTEE